MIGRLSLGGGRSLCAVCSADAVPGETYCAAHTLGGGRGLNKAASAAMPRRRDLSHACFWLWLLVGWNGGTRGLLFW